MYCNLLFPSPEKLNRFLSKQAQQSLPYREVGQSASTFPPGYDHDRNAILLGKGEATFEIAKRALADWQMFPKQWTSIYPHKTNLRQGEDVAVLFRLFGLWWLNASRIIYTLNTANRFGFAYGTLPAHVERGEECFSVFLDDQQDVWYEVKAFSKPGYWWVQLVYPMARFFQKRFVQDSKAQMLQYVQQQLSHEQPA